MIILSLFHLIWISRHKQPRVAELKPFRNIQHFSNLIQAFSVSSCDHLHVQSVDMVWWQCVLAAVLSRELCSCQLSTSNIHREGLLPGALLSQSAHSIQQQTQYQSRKRTFAKFELLQSQKRPQLGQSQALLVEVSCLLMYQRYNAFLAQCLNSILNVKTLVGTFNQEKALSGTLSMIVTL